MADFNLTVGLDYVPSFVELKAGITKIVEAINKNPAKIKVSLDEASLKSMAEQISAMQVKLAGNVANAPVDTSGLKKVSREAENAASSVKNLNKELNDTSKASKGGDAAERSLRKMADAARQARALLDANMNAKGMDSYEKLSSNLAVLERVLRECGGDAKMLEGVLEESGINGAEAVERVTTAVATLKQELQATNSGGTLSLTDITSTYASMQSMLNANGRFANTDQFKALEAQATAFRGVIEACNGDVTKLEAALQQFGLNGASAISDAKQRMAEFRAVMADPAKETAALNAYTTQIAQAETRLRQWTAAENSKNASSREAYANLQSAVAQAQIARASYDGTAESVRNLENANANLSTTMKESERVIRGNGDATKSFMDRMGGLAQKFGAWLSITRIIMMVIRTIRQMIRASIELDTAFTQMQVVTKASSAEMEKFGEAAARTAQRTASAITDIVNSATTYARLGYSLDESLRLSEYTAMLQNVGNIDASSAQDAITSIVKAFDDVDSSNIESVMDKLVEVGNHFPISVSEIAEGMNNASSTLAAAGNNFDQSVALLTAANTTIQNAAKASTGLRTIAARIRNTKAELDDLGEVVTKANYNEIVQMLTDWNVALTDVNGEYRSTYDIMKDIADRWDEMGSMRQAAMATALSGTRQQAVFYSIIDQFREASGAMDAMADSAGALDAAYSTYLNSIQAHINQFKAVFQDFSANLFNSAFLKSAVDFGTGLLTVFNELQKIHMLLPTIIASLVAIKGLKIAKSVSSIVSGLVAEGAVTDGLKASIVGLSAAEKQLLYVMIARKVASGEMTAETANQIIAILGLSGAEKELAATNGVLAASFKAVTASIPIWGWIAIVITGIITLMAGLSSATKDSAEKLNTLRSEAREMTTNISNTSNGFRDLKNNVAEIAPRLSELAQGVDQFGNNVSLTEEEYQEFLDINNRLAEMFPELNMGMDSNGNYMLALSYSADTLTDSLNKLVEAEREAANQEIADMMPDMLKNIVDTRKELQKQRDSLQSEFDLLTDTYNKLMNGDYSTSQTFTINSEAEKKLLDREKERLRQLGVDVTSKFVGSGGRDATFELSYQFDINDITTNYQNAMSGFNQRVASINKQMEDSWTQLNPVIAAWMSTDYNYNALSDEMQQVALRIAENLDWASLNLTTAEDVQDYITRNVLTPLNNMSPKVQDMYRRLFAVDTADKSAKKYIADISQIAQDIAKETGESYTNILSQTGFDDVIDQYREAAQEIASSVSGASSDLVLTLSPGEILKSLDIVKTYGIQTWNDLQSALENKTFEIAIDFETESESFAKLNTALNESVSATGLASESMEALQERYQDLEGYNPAVLFEHTANGIHLNAEALEELEAEYQKTNKVALDTKLEDLARRYNDLTDAINNEADAAKRIEMYSQRDALLAEINDTKNLITQYNGLTSAYNQWTQAKSQTDNRSGYENIGKGYDTVKDLLERGWVTDSEVDKYLDLLIAADQRTKDNVEDFKRLSETIEGTDFSITDFFQYDDDNNITASGLQNFLDAVSQKLGEEFVQIREDGGYTFDFTGEKLQQVADALGLSTDAVQILEQALVDAGFDVAFDSTFSNIDAIINGSKDALAVLQELKDNGEIESEIDFNFNTTDIEDVQDQIERAKTLLEEFADEDGNIDLTVEGAQQAATVLATLIYRKNDLEAPAIMGIKVDSEMAKTEIGAAIKLMQDFKEATALLEYQTELGIDTTQAQQNVDALLQEIQENKTITGSLNIDTTSVDTTVEGINNTTPEMLVEAGLDSTEVDEYNPDDLERTVTFKCDSTRVDTFITTLRNTNLDKTVRVTYVTTNSPPGSGTAQGTAHARGTAMVHGYWGARNSGIALGGEMGPELIVRDGSFFTIGDNSAELFRYKKGDIIFNAEQTRQIFANGKIEYGAKRGVAYVTGTAFDRGTGGFSSLGGGATRHPLDYPSGSGSGSSSRSSSSSSRSSSNSSKASKEEESWFEKQYKLHNHLVKMCQEDMEEYLKWLNTAYQKAYDEGVIELDDYRKYREEVFKGLQDLFMDYIGDIEHEISMISEDKSQTNRVVKLYSTMLKAIEKEIESARQAGLKDTDDYIQQLQKKLQGFQKELTSMREDALKEYQDAEQELVDLRIKMIKQEIDDRKDGLNKQLSDLKDFYQKQKDMLRDSREEEKYLDDQAEKRKKISDIERELSMLQRDNSAWAAKRRLELEEELSNARKELIDFEKDHAIEVAEEELDKISELREKDINSQIEELESITPHEIYEKALYDIKHATNELFNESIDWNNVYGDGIEKNIIDMWERAKTAFEDYWNTVRALTNDGDSVMMRFAGGFLRDFRGYVSPSKLKFASGTSYAPPGLHMLDEYGSETIFQSKNGQKYKMFSGGEKVLNAKASDFLYKFATTGAEFFSKLFSGATNGFNNLVGGNRRLAVEAVNMGDIIINGNADQSTVSEIRRAQRDALENLLREFDRLSR